MAGGLVRDNYNKLRITDDPQRTFLSTTTTILIVFNKSYVCVVRNVTLSDGYTSSCVSPGTTGIGKPLVLQ